MSAQPLQGDDAAFYAKHGYLPPAQRGNVASLEHSEGRTENEFATRVAIKHGSKIRYLASWRRFLIYDGQRWQLDIGGGLVAAHIRSEVREAFRELDPLADEMSERDFNDAVKFVRSMGTARGIDATARLLQSDDGIPITPDQLDRFQFVLNTPTGVVDLRDGRLHKHDPNLLLSKLTTVEYATEATCPTWERFLSDVLQDEELVDHMQKLVGYMLTAAVTEQKLFIFWGNGANGKSTAVETLLNVFGEYATIGAPDLLMAKGMEAHPTEIASLYGHRLVVCSETEEGRRLAEARVKQFTGGDTLTARRMREDFWSFTPVHKLLLLTNHKPLLRGTDYGIRRRLHLIPFTRTFKPEEQDRELGAKLRSELSGILTWAVQGAIRWKAEGLGEPAAVKAATAEYLASQDTIGRFIDECCELRTWDKTRASALYEAYRMWSETQGEHPVTLKRLGQSIEERGFEKRTSNGVWYVGIGLKPEGLE